MDDWGLFFGHRFRHDGQSGFPGVSVKSLDRIDGEGRSRGEFSPRFGLSFVWLNIQSGAIFVTGAARLIFLRFAGEKNIRSQNLTGCFGWLENKIMCRCAMIGAMISKPMDGNEFGVWIPDRGAWGFELDGCVSVSNF